MPRSTKFVAATRQAVSDLIADILRPDFLRPSISEDALARELGVTQGTFNKWKNGAICPTSENYRQLLKMHAQAVYHHWGCKGLIPLCAIAEHYPPTLKHDASEALTTVVNRLLLSQPSASMRHGLRRDVHICAAPLPSDVSAYTFVDDLVQPLVFVVLVNDAFSIPEQNSMAVREFYAHVTNLGHDAQPLNHPPQSPIRHYPIGKPTEPTDGSNTQ